jgi:hypothetical protein
MVLDVLYIDFQFNHDEAYSSQKGVFQFGPTEANRQMYK